MLENLKILKNLTWIVKNWFQYRVLKNPTIFTTLDEINARFTLKVE